MNSKNLHSLEYMEIFGMGCSSISLIHALSLIALFSLDRLGYSQDVMYNISIASIIQKVLGIFLINDARMIAASIFS